MASFAMFRDHALPFDRIRISAFSDQLLVFFHRIVYRVAFEHRYSQLCGASSTSFLKASQDIFLNWHPLKIFVGAVIINLTYIYIVYILIHMKTTLNIDETILKRAAELTGIKEKTSLVRLGLQALIAQESSRRLAKLGGTEKSLRPIPRRRPANR
jgi:Arc/MetJ family transcription regulator